MVVKKIISDMWGSIWPMITFISIIAITLRAAYVFRGIKRYYLGYLLFMYYVYII